MGGGPDRRAGDGAAPRRAGAARRDAQRRPLRGPQARGRGFLANGFFVLAGDRQVEDLDEEVDLTADPELVFVKLVPLAGG
ncbi:hypothetical protein E1287_32375 [Actinomadura sp. KC06]|nr:hypothetical protein E1287_32375 [Actinomadura sp. KC06]